MYRNKILKFSLILLVSTLTLNNAYSQKGKDTLYKERFSFVDLSQGFGGNFYLNYVDFNPMLGVHIGHGRQLNEKASIAVASGFETMDRESFIPVFMRAQYQMRRQFVYIDFGYSFGLLKKIYDYDEYSYNGGVMADIAYGVTLWESDRASWDIYGAYQYRKASIKFTPKDTQGELKSNFHFNHIALGTSLRFR